MKADWTKGIWTSDTEAESTARITIASDWLPLRGYEDAISTSPLAVYGDLLPLFRASDLNLVNIECTLGSKGQAHVLFGDKLREGGPPFRADESAVRSLTEVPFHVACTANNHIMDFGPESLENTLNVLRGAGLRTVGAGLTGDEASEPLLMKAGDTRLAILNCGEGEWCCSIDNGPGANGFEISKIIKKIQVLKREVELILVIFHGGREYAPLPPEYVVKNLRAVAEAGASAVIAHHPHVPQGIEVHNGVPIVYSQGNFVFWQEEDSFYKHAGYLVHLDVERERIVKMEISPYLIGRSRLSLMQGAMKSHFLDTLHAVSELLARPEDVRSVWNAFADEIGMAGLMRTLTGRIGSVGIDERMGAGLLLNIFFTPAHRELYIDALRRAADGRLGDSPEWARALVAHWANYRLSEGKEQYEVGTPVDGIVAQVFKK
jgi:poly-gamma-glutamate synthesis protein (capsule biosynthesis protein)